MVSVSCFQHCDAVQISFSNLTVVELFVGTIIGVARCSVDAQDLCRRRLWCYDPAISRLLGNMHPMAANAGLNSQLCLHCMLRKVSSDRQALTCLDHNFIVSSMAPARQQIGETSSCRVPLMQVHCK